MGEYLSTGVEGALNEMRQGNHDKLKCMLNPESAEKNNFPRLGELFAELGNTGVYSLEVVERQVMETRMAFDKLKQKKMT